MAANKLIALKERIISSISSISGLSGIFSSYSVCHSICMTAISLLSIIGITVAGMPLLFLQQVALPIWIFAVVLFGVTLILYYKKRHCMPKNMLTLNFGLLVIGTPFVQDTGFKLYFWVAGGIIAAAAIIMPVKNKLSKTSNREILVTEITDGFKKTAKKWLGRGADLKMIDIGY